MRVKNNHLEIIRRSGEVNKKVGCSRIVILLYADNVKCVFPSR